MHARVNPMGKFQPERQSFHTAICKASLHAAITRIRRNPIPMRSTFVGARINVMFNIVHHRHSRPRRQHLRHREGQQMFKGTVVWTQGSSAMVAWDNGDEPSIHMLAELRSMTPPSFKDYLVQPCMPAITNVGSTVRVHGTIVGILYPLHSRNDFVECKWVKFQGMDSLHLIPLSSMPFKMPTNASSTKVLTLHLFPRLTEQQEASIPIMDILLHWKVPMELRYLQPFVEIRCLPTTDKVSILVHVLRNNVLSKDI